MMLINKVPNYMGTKENDFIVTVQTYSVIVSSEMSAKISPSSSVGRGCSFLTIFWIKYPFLHFSSSSSSSLFSSSSSSYSKQTQKLVFVHILRYVYFFRSMLQDYLSVAWIVFWISMFLLCYHLPSEIGLRLRLLLLQFAIHSQIICSLCDSLSFFLLGNKKMYYLSM